MSETVSAGGVSVEVRGTLCQAARDVIERAAADRVPSRLVSKDPTIWGPEAEPEAKIRLGWVDLPATSRELLPRLAELRDRIRDAGLDHVVLAGMGGSSLAPEVITRGLTVLDTTDPHQVARTLGDRIDRTVVVVASKSGSTIETDSHRRAYEQAFRDAGFSAAEIRRRVVVVTDPGSPLEAYATGAGYEVVLADPNVGGRYSALSAFGLVPSALAGADVTELLDAAAELAPTLALVDDNPGLLLGAALGGAGRDVDGAGQDKVVIADNGSGLLGFGDWAEQLIAESTGKEGRGLLPVVVEDTSAPGFAGAGPDAHLVTLGAAAHGDGTTVAGPLGAQFLLWEYATAVAGWVLGINPFDQPNVQESKDNTKALLERAGDGPLPEGEPVFVDDAVAVYADPLDGVDPLGGARDLRGALEALLRAVPDRGYLAVMAYLDRYGESAVAGVRPALARRLAGRQVTFGWGPRFLHSTGQYHKGGPQRGAFLQITGAVATDLPVPGKPYTFGRLQLAQALGDLGALRSRRRPVVRLHLRDRTAGVQQLLSVIAEG
ncbi:glucose-6-phosphate isomerase [Carbonactinospora thermoautotrophica]|uniref:glucose-6-phosphate isomerase n=1 Tax=Carbonactinospora thermoautotrophica TaxID=1469144 RepID=UPI00226E4F74|nr:glucose-6-phosphate isomerase [Carbonactinospora thermoautotrophica]MCX9191109.1 glucose-6-phosphate isomerase [Carbonactinospora thermoautotrophica]